MPKLKFKGLDEYIEKLEKLTFDSEKYLGEALYKGAGLVADNLKNDLRSIPIQEESKDNKKRTINQRQKDGLIDGMGIARKQETKNGINVKVGVGGYNKMITKKYPHGQPNIMIARSLESGTSFMPKNRVFSRSINRSKKDCESTMKKIIEDNIQKIMK